MQGIGLELGPESKKDVVQHSFYRSAVCHWILILILNIFTKVANGSQPVATQWRWWRLLLSTNERQGTHCKDGATAGWHSSTGLVCQWHTMSWSNTHIWIAFHKHDTKICTELLFKMVSHNQAVRATPIPVTWMTREEDSLLTGQVTVAKE